MALMPGVPYRSAVERSAAAMTRHDVVCIHTIVGYASGGAAAHFTTSAKGEIVQCRDTAYQSAANLNGNHRVIAVENEDHGPAYGSWNTNDGHAVPGFTGPQREAIARILAWAYKAHGIPLVLVPDSKPSSRGIAYHRQGIDGSFGPYAYPGRVAGGEVWTKHSGKVCPGDRRIKELIEVIIPRARVLAGLQQAEDDVALTELFEVTKPDGGKFKISYGAAIQNLYYMMFYGSAFEPWAGPGVAADLAHLRKALAEQADVDETAIGNQIAAQLAPMLPDLMARLSDQDVKRIADAAADEEDRRARTRLEA